MFAIFLAFPGYGPKGVFFAFLDLRRFPKAFFWRSWICGVFKKRFFGVPGFAAFSISYFLDRLVEYQGTDFRNTYICRTVFVQEHISVLQFMNTLFRERISGTHFRNTYF